MSSGWIDGEIDDEKDTSNGFTSRSIHGWLLLSWWCINILVMMMMIMNEDDDTDDYDDDGHGENTNLITFSKHNCSRWESEIPT